MVKITEMDKDIFKETYSEKIFVYIGTFEDMPKKALLKFGDAFTIRNDPDNLYAYVGNDRLLKVNIE